MLRQTRHRIAAVLRALGSLLPADSDRRRPAARVIRPWNADSFRTYPCSGLTPTRLLSLLQAADAGTPQQQFELYGDMLQKWPRLAAVEATRRLALTGLEWEIQPAAQSTVRDTSGGRRAIDFGFWNLDFGLGSDGTRSRSARSGREMIGASVEEAESRGEKAEQVRAASDSALRAADFCRDALGRLERFGDVLDHMAAAIGFGLAVAELVWERGQLVDVVPVPHSRLIADPHEPWRLRVLTEDDPSLGVPLDEQPLKWLVHRPRGTPGRPFEGGLLRASALLFLAQNLSFKDWLIYSQIAGMPVRVAQFEPGTPDGEKQALLRMLEALGTDAVAVMSKSVELKLIEPGRTGDRPYQPLQDYCNTEVTILWLGQHLTTDIRTTGSRAAAEIHDRVREDLLVDDIADEGRTIRRDLLTPLVRVRFGDGVAVPQFRRSLVQAVDTRVLADTLAVAVNELGLAVPRRWVHDALGVPQPQAGEPVLGGRSGT